MSQDSVKTRGPFGAGSLDQAPANAIGLYAWYARPVLGRGDWANDGSGGDADKAVEQFLAALQNHSNRMTPPDVNLKGQSPFGQTWAGSISIDSLDSPMTYKSHLAEETGREAVARVLTDAPPTFAAPVYIGVTDNLRRRLMQHMTALQLVYGARSREPSVMTQSYDFGELGSEIDNVFAIRAIDAGFAPDHMIVWVLDFSELTQRMGREATYKVAKAAELTLNRWYRPLLGRR